MNDKQANLIYGFWRRIFAAMIDYVILGIFGFILSIFFSKLFVEMGCYGRIIGFITVLLYFGVLNSVIGKGRSLGKTLVHIIVVDKDGKFISIYKSFLRVLILEVPFF